MSTYFNLSGCVHVDGEIHMPALTINGKTWVKVQRCATHKEASDTAEAMVDMLASVAFAQLIAAEWIQHDEG